MSGRIDHLAIDLKRQRLIAAELGNDSVGVVDLEERKAVRTLAGLHEPQGVGYVPSTDTLYVADAKDGTVHMFEGAELSPAGRIELGDDADNIRVDAQSSRVFIGYGSGALAAIDPDTRAKVASIPLEAHPEGFQVEPASQRIYVNVPDAGQIAVIDAASGKQIATWPTRDARANFPMALDAANKRVLVAFRRPAKLVAYRAEDGSALSELAICGDGDDVFVDTKRRRVYVSCGEGFIDVLEERGSRYERIDHVATASGARTSLLVPELDKLFVAVRARWGVPAAIWIFRPK